MLTSGSRVAKLALGERRAATEARNPKKTSLTGYNCRHNLMNPARAVTSAEERAVTTIAYRVADVDALKIFYREAGASEAPKLLLLHGFPTSSHMFGDLIPLLADRFHIVAPDLPGFGQSDQPKANTFESLADTIERFTEIVGFDRFAVYVFD